MLESLLKLEQLSNLADVGAALADGDAAVAGLGNRSGLEVGAVLTRNTPAAEGNYKEKTRSYLKVEAVGQSTNCL